MPKTVAIKTVGCKLNQYDSEVMRCLFEQAGYLSRPFDSEADVYVLNTCTVTAKSDRDCRRLACQAARRNPGATVVVTGCYAERDPEALASLPGVSAVVGKEGKWNLPDLLNGRGRGQHVGEPLWGVQCGGRPQSPTRQSRYGDGAGAAPTFIAGLGHFGSLTRAFLKIQDGCDDRCAYCVVPLVRGGSRSRPLEEVSAEAQRFIASGHREIVLVGVHLGAYGKDLQCRGEAACGERSRTMPRPEGLGDSSSRPYKAQEIDLVGCLRQLLALPGLGRVRLSSLEPLEVTPEIVSLLAGEPKLCRHLHLPLQSGDGAVLSRMNRKYRAADYAEIVNEVARAVPGISIGADVIVGFPGETEEEFRNTCGFIEGLPLAYLHVFSYSRRPGTAAASMPNQAPEQVKRRRCGYLRALSERKQVAFRRHLLGTRQTVLIEKGCEEEETMCASVARSVGEPLAPSPQRLPPSREHGSRFGGGAWRVGDCGLPNNGRGQAHFAESSAEGLRPPKAEVGSATKVESPAPTGLTGNYVRVSVSNAPPAGDLVEVRITRVNGMAVEGQALAD